MMFAPLPEIFAGLAWLPKSSPAVHLRFGSVRDARVLKGMPNAAVVAETGQAPPLTASHHPFASGRLLPAAMDGIFVYGDASFRPRRIGGAELPAFHLPPACLDGDLAAARRGKGRGGGLDLVALADFSSDDWAAGRVAAPPARPLSDRGAVLVPWNMAHFGSIIPDLLERLASLWAEGNSMPNLVLLPFNDLGQTGVLRILVKLLATAAPAALLANIFFARVTHLRGLARLKQTIRTAWVDGNDPECTWTLGRLAACGIDPVLIDPGAPSLLHARRVVADEAIWVTSDTRYGKLSFDVRLPSLRLLPALLASSR